MSRKTEYLRGVTLEIKADADTGVIEGYGSVFDVMDLGQDIVAKGAFTESLTARAASAIKMLWQHDPSDPVGVWEEASQDDNGLLMRGRILTETTKGRDAMAFVRAGVIDGLSIGYRVKDYEMSSDNKIRTIKEAELWEVSLVTFPMNEAARIHAVKSAEEIDAMTDVEIERHLREASDLSRAEAKRIVHRLMSLGAQRKAAELEDAHTALMMREFLQKLRG